MKKGNITLKQLQKLYKSVSNQKEPTILYNVGGTKRNGNYWNLFKRVNKK